MSSNHRISLIPASGILSSYKKKYKQEFWDISVFNNQGQKGNYITPDFFQALQRLNKSIQDNKGSLKIIDLYRSWEIQSENRQKYLTGKKKAYVAKPGGSFHNAGRAVDIKLEELQFEGIDRDDWLEALWDIAIPLGFRPIIKMPDMDASEAWHMDYAGKDWQTAYDKLNYSEVAKCCTLDIGGWNPQEDPEKVNRMFAQAQLIRLGYFEIGKVDGIFGTKTKSILSSLGVDHSDVQSVIRMLLRGPQ